MTNNIASLEREKNVPQVTGNASRLSRRKFLNYATASTGLVLIAAGCEKDDAVLPDSGVDLGSGDVGILNYAYALEQLEAAFYLQVIATPYANMSAREKELLTDIRNHEIAHREFFKTALGGSAIQALEVDFSKINFSSRDSVLATAKAFEDLGVAAYNGAGGLIKDAGYLTLAGKIVSVEARHAALIRDLISNGTFVGSDIIDANGLEMSKTPPMVLTIASAFIKTKINASNLPS